MEIHGEKRQDYALVTRNMCGASVQKMNHSLGKKKQGLLMNLQIANSFKTDQQVQFLSPIQETQLERILHKFEKIFSVPNALPPKGTHDHHIPLKNGSIPYVNLIDIPIFRKNE